MVQAEPPTTTTAPIFTAALSEEGAVARATACAARRDAKREEALRASKAKSADHEARWEKESPRWLTLAAAKRPFQVHSNACVNGICVKLKEEGSGWDDKAGRPCVAVEYSDRKMSWFRWDKMERGKSRDRGGGLA